MPPICEGQTFSTLHAFKDALREWAIERNWTPHILDSDSHRVRAGCRSAPNCPFRIRANYSAKRDNAKVTTVDDVHNCEPFRVGETLSHQPIRRAETGKLKFLLDAVPKLMNVTVDTSRHDIIAAVERKYGQKIPVRQAQKVKAGLVERVKGPCRQCHQIGHTRRHCPRLMLHASNDPMDISNVSNTMQRRETYVDGDMEDDFEDPQTPPFQSHPPPPGMHVNGTDPGGETIDPSLRNGAPQLHYGETPVPPRPMPQSMRPPMPRQMGQHTAAPIRTAAEIRLEAARLMEEAGRLMKEAAEKSARAAELNASVAHL